ncbi:hypothetical protein DIPPA_25359 [Diplonema papillatum]|nr:hypothetical protein DIPPA_25359 [Diplonema papillatum]KAJ9455739.1 hypothetical protein DIPPA_25359 [Diplonema papillatum]
MKLKPSACRPRAAGKQTRLAPGKHRQACRRSGGAPRAKNCSSTSRPPDGPDQSFDDAAGRASASAPSSPVPTQQQQFRTLAPSASPPPASTRRGRRASKPEHPPLFRAGAAPSVARAVSARAVLSWADAGSLVGWGSADTQGPCCTVRACCQQTGGVNCTAHSRGAFDAAAPSACYLPGGTPAGSRPQETCPKKAAGVALLRRLEAACNPSLRDAKRGHSTLSRVSGSASRQLEGEACESCLRRAGAGGGFLKRRGEACESSLRVTEGGGFAVRRLEEAADIAEIQGGILPGCGQRFVLQQLENEACESSLRVTEEAGFVVTRLEEAADIAEIQGGTITGSGQERCTGGFVLQQLENEACESSLCVTEEAGFVESRLEEAADIATIQGGTITGCGQAATQAFAPAEGGLDGFVARQTDAHRWKHATGDASSLRNGTDPMLQLFVPEGDADGGCLLDASDARPAKRGAWRGSFFCGGAFLEGRRRPTAAEGKPTAGIPPGGEFDFSLFPAPGSHNDLARSWQQHGAGSRRPSSITTAYTFDTFEYSDDSGRELRSEPTHYSLSVSYDPHTDRTDSSASRCAGSGSLRVSSATTARSRRSGCDGDRAEVRRALRGMSSLSESFLSSCSGGGGTAAELRATARHEGDGPDCLGIPVESPRGGFKSGAKNSWVSSRSSLFTLSQGSLACDDRQCHTSPLPAQRRPSKHRLSFDETSRASSNLTTSFSASTSTHPSQRTPEAGSPVQTQADPVAADHYSVVLSYNYPAVGSLYSRRTGQVPVFVSTGAADLANCAKPEAVSFPSDRPGFDPTRVAAESAFRSFFDRKRERSCRHHPSLAAPHCRATLPRLGPPLGP